MADDRNIGGGCEHANDDLGLLSSCRFRVVLRLIQARCREEQSQLSSPSARAPLAPFPRRTRAPFQAGNVTVKPRDVSCCEPALLRSPFVTDTPRALDGHGAATSQSLWKIRQDRSCLDLAPTSDVNTVLGSGKINAGGFRMAADTGRQRSSSRARRIAQNLRFTLAAA